MFRFGAFEATIDAYRIEVDNRIVLSENLGLTPDGLSQRADIGALLEPFNIDIARFFINGVDTETQGVDLVVRYGVGLGAGGKLDLTAAANYNETDATRANLNTNGLAPFSRYSPFGFNGRFLYGRLSWNW